MDLSGIKVGKLTVLSLNPQDPRKGKYWNCLCECGNKSSVLEVYLINGRTKSCGCSKKKPFYKTHGLSNTRLNRIYRKMKDRCFNEKSLDYKYYGLKGISVCKEWLDDFMNFYNWAIKNGYNEQLTLDRIDVNGNYCPENCRWATRQQQSNNTSRNTFYEYKGETHTLSEWGRKVNLSPSTIISRMKRGWSFEKSITTQLKNNQFSEEIKFNVNL